MTRTSSVKGSVTVPEPLPASAPEPAPVPAVKKGFEKDASIGEVLSSKGLGEHTDLLKELGVNVFDDLRFAELDDKRFLALPGAARNRIKSLAKKSTSAADRRGSLM